MSTAAPSRSLGPLVNGLTAAVALQWIGAGAVLPTLPVFLTQRGASPALVGLAMGAFFLAGVLTQYPVGTLTDRVGERPVLVAGLLLYAVASLAFLAPVSPWACVGVRFLQGAGAGAVEVASLAAIGRHVAPDRRGSGFARIFAGQLGGLGLGPLLGALAGTRHLGVLFLFSAIASALAAVAVAAVVPRASGPVEPEERRERLAPGRGRLLAGLVCVATIGGLTTGVYETCWTLLLETRGASTFVIGLSWTLFCVPIVVMTPLAGRLADRLERTRLITVSLLGTAVLVGVYPFVGSLPAVLALGVLEAVGTSVAFPAAQAVLADGVPTSVLGRAQGLFTATQTAATAVAAAGGGALFGVGRAVPFVAAGVVGVALLTTLPLVWRRGSAPHSPAPSRV